MPMIELTLPQGALDKASQDALMEQLTSTLLRWEGAPEDSETAKTVSWGYVDERPTATLYQGGRPQPAEPLYRVTVTVPVGALDDERKSGLVGEMTRQVLAADGASDDDEAAALRVWVILREVTDGNWGAAGRIFRLRDIARFVMGDRSRESAAA